MRLHPPRGALLTDAVRQGNRARYASWPDIWARRPPHSEHPEDLMRSLREVDFLPLDEVARTVASAKEQARLLS